MPIYAYKCRDCKHEFEVLRKITDEPLKTCPECQSPVNRVFQPVGIIFKGSGFYTTDYKRKSDQKQSKPSSPNGDKSGKPDKNEKPKKEVNKEDKAGKTANS